MKSEAPSVDRYLTELSPDRRQAIAVLRRLVLETVPTAVESMRYGMPTYHYEGAMLAAMAAQKNYTSLYLDTELVAHHGDELAHLRPGKSCIRFTRLERLPQDTVRAILTETVARIQQGSTGSREEDVP